MANISLSSELSDYLEITTEQSQKDLTLSLTKTEKQVNQLRDTRLEVDTAPPSTAVRMLEATEWLTDTTIGSSSDKATGLMAYASSAFSGVQLAQSAQTMLINPDPIAKVKAAAGVLSNTISLLSNSSYCPKNLQTPLSIASELLSGVMDKHDRFSDPDPDQLTALTRALSDLKDSIGPYLSMTKLELLRAAKDYAVANTRSEGQSDKAKILKESEEFKDLMEELKKQSAAFSEQIKFYHKMHKDDFKQSKDIFKK